MQELINYITGYFHDKEKERIHEVDQNPDKWYELSITEENNESETVEKSGIFQGIIGHLGKYVTKYGFDHVQVNIWQNKSAPLNIYNLFSVPVIYLLIVRFHKNTGDFDDMQNIGEVTFSVNPVSQVYSKDFSGEGYIYKDKIAFKYFMDLTCYISDLADEDDPDDRVTRRNLLDICHGNVELAELLFDHLKWTAPETLLEEWNTDEVEDMSEPLLKALLINKLPKEYLNMQKEDDSIHELALSEFQRIRDEICKEYEFDEDEYISQGDGTSPFDELQEEILKEVYKRIV